MRRHIIRTHSSRRSYSCPECDAVFTWKRHLHKHLISHRQQIDFKFDSRLGFTEEQAYELDTEFIDAQDFNAVPQNESHLNGVSRNVNSFGQIRRNILSLNDIVRKGGKSTSGIDSGRNTYIEGRRDGNINGFRGGLKVGSNVRKDVKPPLEGRSGSDEVKRCHLCNASYTNLKDHLLQRHVL